MSKSEKVIDITGVELTPGEPDVCLGSGEQGFACWCDECNYYLICFPEFDVKDEEIEEELKFISLTYLNSFKELSYEEFQLETSIYDFLFVKAD